MTDAKFKQAADYLAGARRTLADAERVYAEEHGRLAASGRLYEIKTVEHGHEVTRYAGDISATFGPFMAPPRLGRVARGGGR